MSTLLRGKNLLQKEPLKTIQVDLGRNEHVFVREMTGRERDTFERSLMKSTRDKKGKLDQVLSLEDFRAKLAVSTLCDNEGNALLLSGDVSVLSRNMGASRLMKIADAAGKLNSIGEEDREALIKNSEGDQVANSSSASAKN